MQKCPLGRRTIACLLSPLVLCIFVISLPAWAGDNLEEQMRTEYQNKVLTQRHFYGGDHLVYRFDGSLIDEAKVGPWTVDGQISVLDVEVREQALHIHGRRVFLVFDSKAKPYRDVLDLLKESDDPNRDEEEKFYRSQEVEIDIGLPSNSPDLSEATTAMNAVFLAPGESMAAIVPSFWRDYLEQQESLPRSVPHTAEPLQDLASGGVTAPNATYMPEPGFSEWALRAKVQGTITMSVVADTSGAVSDVQIVQPLGLGLDEKAVDSVSAWKFDPAKKNGTPVPVELMVEVDFSLY